MSDEGYHVSISIPENQYYSGVVAHVSLEMLPDHQQSNDGQEKSLITGVGKTYSFSCPEPWSRTLHYLHA